MAEATPMDPEVAAYRRKSGLNNLSTFVLDQAPERPAMPSETVSTCIENCLRWLEGTDLDPRTNLAGALEEAGVTHAALGKLIARQFKIATADGVRGVQPGDAVPVPFAEDYIVPADEATTSSPSSLATQPAARQVQPSF